MFAQGSTLAADSHLDSRFRHGKRTGPAPAAWGAQRQVMAQTVIQLSFPPEPVG
jgi:hypothetical protein